MAGLFVHPLAGSGGGERTSPCHTLSNSDFSRHKKKKNGALNATDKEMPVQDREASQECRVRRHIQIWAGLREASPCQKHSTLVAPKGLKAE